MQPINSEGQLQLHALANRQRFIGIDLATGKRMAQNTWLACITLHESGPLLQSCHELSALEGAKTNLALALYRHLHEEKQAIIGVDASFGIPLKLLGESSWHDWLSAYPTLYGDAKTFRRVCQDLSPPGKELKRQTDRDAKTPFSPYNLRHYRQVDFTLRDLLRPIVSGRKASVLPFDAPAPSQNWLLELCPASILRRLLELNRLPAYKGKTEAHAAERENIWRALQAQYPFKASAEMRDEILTQSGGDALDSVVMAWYAFQLWHENPGVFYIGEQLKKHQPDSYYLREGLVF